VNEKTSQDRRITLITGASGGIGADLARVFALHGHHLALVARSRDKLEALADEIAASGRSRPLPLVFDLTQNGAAAAIAAALQTARLAPDILVNNAGFGLAGEVAKLDAAEQLAMVDLNVRALVEITLRFLPEIRAARGKILNVCSGGAYFPGGPGMTLYYASKSFVLSFSLGLSQELRPDGVTVTALCPGFVPTGFHARAGLRADIFLNRLSGKSPIEVAEAGYAGLMAGKRSVVPGLFNKIGLSLLPFIQKDVILMFISRMQQKRRDSV
jgi:short-subunit dehydrogenase